MVFTYNKEADCFNEDFNASMDYIVRNLPGVTVTAEKNGLVQISADETAAKAIKWLDTCDTLQLFTGMTIETVEAFD